MSLLTTVIDIEAVGGGRVVIKTMCGVDLIVGPDFSDVLDRIIAWATPRLQRQRVGRRMLCDDVSYEHGHLYWALAQQPGERDQALVLCLHGGDPRIDWAAIRAH